MILLEYIVAVLITNKKIGYSYCVILILSPLRACHNILTSVEANCATT